MRGMWYGGMCVYVVCQQMDGLDADLALQAPCCAQDVPIPPPAPLHGPDTEIVGKYWLGILDLYGHVVASSGL